MATTWGSLSSKIELEIELYIKKKRKKEKKEESLKKFQKHGKISHLSTVKRRLVPFYAI